jgi:hypothetical protein
LLQIFVRRGRWRREATDYLAPLGHLYATAAFGLLGYGVFEMEKRQYVTSLQLYLLLDELLEADWQGVPTSRQEEAITGYSRKGEPGVSGQAGEHISGRRVGSRTRGTELKGGHWAAELGRTGGIQCTSLDMQHYDHYTPLDARSRRSSDRQYDRGLLALSFSTA